MGRQNNKNSQKTTSKRTNSPDSHYLISKLSESRQHTTGRKTVKRPATQNPEIDPHRNDFLIIIQRKPKEEFFF